jgi:hypothetical protein
LSQVITQVYKNYGILGFYSGYLPRILKKAFSTGLLWTIYESLSKQDEKN